MKRDVAVDIVKGIAILIVYLGHSVLYYPIEMANLYPWCAHLNSFIISFNMPLFFVISGLLFARSTKNYRQVIADKVKRLFIPYLSTMFILLLIKSVVPKSLSYNAFGGIMGGGEECFDIWR